MTSTRLLSFYRPPSSLLLVGLLLLLADVIPTVEAGTTFDVQFIGAPATPLNATTNQSGLNMTVLGSNTTLLLDSHLKSAPGNSTDTSSGSNDTDLSWWMWLMIGGGFFILIVVLVVTAVFYSDYAKHLMGYKQVPEGGEATASKTAVKVIEVDLVHPCRPPPCVLMSDGGIP